MALPAVAIFGLAAYWMMYASIVPEARSHWEGTRTPPPLVPHGEGDFITISRDRFQNLPKDLSSDLAFGTGALLASYAAQAAMVIWGPPPVKALGVAWAVAPMADPIIFGLGTRLNPF